MKAPDGIAGWTGPKFRQWAGVRIETHSEQLARLEKAVAAQNKLVLDLRREVVVVSAVLARATRPSPPDTAARLGEMANDGLG